MADPSQDVTLVRQVLAGDKRSFTQLVDTHKNKIYGLLRGLGASPQDAQDYTQEAFLKAYRPIRTRAQRGFFVLLDQVLVLCSRQELDPIADNGQELVNTKGSVYDKNLITFPTDDKNIVTFRKEFHQRIMCIFSVMILKALLT
ncbi:sigma factor [Paenibacillus sp. Cedars]|uniref:sigma factor n=1 Tax=Paenibacillus TaxID=44249 RepID=UPI00116567FC|nr:sigma factor [Paenibacillus sp. Cedars]AWP27740.1 hypothetical protein B9D94_14420 [Paenibacillus sp. Cedars]